MISLHERYPNTHRAGLEPTRPVNTFRAGLELTWAESPRRAWKVVALVVAKRRRCCLGWVWSVRSRLWDLLSEPQKMCDEETSYHPRSNQVLLLLRMFVCLRLVPTRRRGCVVSVSARQSRGLGFNSCTCFLTVVKKILNRELLHMKGKTFKIIF